MKRLLLALTLLLVALSTTACDTSRPQPAIRDISVIDRAIPYDDFAYEDINLYVTYVDFSTERVALQASMIDSSVRDALDGPGTYAMEGTYRDHPFSFTLTLTDALDNHLDAVVFDETTLTDDITLPIAFGEEIDATWHSSDEAHLDATGTVVRPLLDDVEVTLTLTLSENERSVSRAFTFVVQALPAHTDFSDLFNDFHAGDRVIIEGVVTSVYEAGLMLYDGIRYVHVTLENTTDFIRGHRVRLDGAIGESFRFIDVERHAVIDTRQDPEDTIHEASLDDLATLDASFSGQAFDVTGTIEKAVDGTYRLEAAGAAITIDARTRSSRLLELDDHSGELVSIRVTYLHDADNPTFIYDGALRLLEPDSAFMGFDVDATEYYVPNLYLPYDGPAFDDDWLGITAYEMTDQDYYMGTGGAYHVTYNRCIDGDTTVFNYPTEIVTRIETNNNSTRYFLMDTPETWPRDRQEPFGALATVYVCHLLVEAESIILQSDPGDRFLDVHGRLLAWVWVRMPGDDDYMLLNYLVVRHGLGDVRYRFGSGETDILVDQGMRFIEWMELAEDLAFADELGIWGEMPDFYYDYENNEIDNNLYPHS